MMSCATRLAGRIAACLSIAALGCGGSSSTEPDPVGSPDSGTETSMDAAAKCPQPLVQCGEACTDTRFDPAHCGACAKACSSKEVCVNGLCAFDCPSGLTKCGTTCVDSLHDPAHCGGCNTACSGQEACVNGLCAFDCPSGLTKCGTTCVDSQHDPAHCGACDKACTGQEACVNGACAFDCPPGLTKCGNACVDALHDPAHCGGCDTACTGQEACVNGVCSFDCPSGLLKCGTNCVDSSHDPMNCGSCHAQCLGGYCDDGICVGGLDGGVVCSPPSTACGTVCVNLQENHENCGACYNSCMADQTCSAGECVCGAGQLLCGGKCVDPSTDGMNCGACGVGCADKEVCSAGVCDCQPGTTRCEGHCLYITIASENCGACGSVCAAPAVCTDGSCGAATSNWHMFGNDPGHSGRNAEETGKPPISAEWHAIIAQKTMLYPVAAESGRAFVTHASWFNETTLINAVSLSDGSPIWQYNFGAVAMAGHPSVVDGTVYVQTNGGTGNSETRLWAFNAANGELRWTAPFGSQSEQFWAPCVVGTRVYINGGTYGGLYGFSTVDGAKLFFNSSLEQYDEWSPAFHDNVLYSFVEGRLRAHDPSTGAELWRVTNEWDWKGWSMQTSPVFSGNRAFVIAPPNLIAISLSAKAIDWTANGAYKGTPATDGSVVYGTSAGTLVARDASTGALAWTFAGDQSLSYPPVLAGSYLYVSSDKNVYAVDLATHKQVWTAPVGGWLAIASRRLLVASKDGYLHGFVLSP